MASNWLSDTYADTSRRPLEGIRVCMLRASDYSMDARVRKQAETLVSAGAEVVLVGVGSEISEDLRRAPYQVILTPAPGGQRLGREDVWWPLRVAVNLTYTRFVQWWHGRNDDTLLPSGPRLAKLGISTHPHIVHAYDAYTLPAAITIKNELGAKVVYDCRDLVGDVEYGSKSARRRYRQVESKLIARADRTITVCEPLADILESRHGTDRPAVIYNGPSELMPTTTEVHSPVRLFFQGAYSFNRNLPALIGAMAMLQGKASLSLQGFGGVEAELRKQVARLGLEDAVFFVPPVSPLDVVAAAAQYDVGVICYQGGNLNLRSAVPNKLMDYLGAGLAVAVSDLPGHRSVLEGTGAGIFIDPSSSATIARDIAGLLDDPERITRMKQAALEAAMSFEWSVQAGKLLGVYESVLDIYEK